MLSVLDVLLESVLRRFYPFALSNAVVLINTMLKALLDDDWHNCAPAVAGSFVACRQ